LPLFHGASLDETTEEVGDGGPLGERGRDVERCSDGGTRWVLVDEEGSSRGGGGGGVSGVGAREERRRRVKRPIVLSWVISEWVTAMGCWRRSRLSIQQDGNVSIEPGQGGARCDVEANVPKQIFCRHTMTM
jgi:hypothetical protein